MKENKDDWFAIAMKVILIITALIIVFCVLAMSDGKDEKLKSLFYIALVFIVIVIRATTRNKQQWQRINEFNGPLINNEGDNKDYSEISSLIDVINEHNLVYPFLKIKLTGIDSKEKLNLDKKYSVKIKKLNGGYIQEINIREQENNA